MQNCYDHAFIDRNYGDIYINVTQKNDYVYISIEDNGIGYNTEKKEQNNLGMQIVTSYVREKLHGKLKITSNHLGTKIFFYFKK